MQTDTIDATETTDPEEAQMRLAKRVAKELRAAFRGHNSADALRLAGEWLVVTSGTGEGFDYAYDPQAIDGTVGGEGWDYSEWCARTSHVYDRDTAIAYYMQTQRELGSAGGGSAVLDEDEIALLKIACRYAVRAS